MARDTPDSLPGPAGQRRLIVAVFAILCFALGAGYYLFLRTDYAILYTGLKPADAAGIVAELKDKGVAYRTRDDGTTILVATDQADEARLSVAGSDVALKGAVGFELFNKSDMGLTDFAQKINYQRALQGELARTIMTMEGVDSARVHLAIPERALFRGNRASPKAAVEVIAKPGRPLTPERVAGIQQLIASAVAELPLADVTVLDGEGHIVSQAAPSQAITTPEIEEQTAAQNYYGARAKAAMANALPGLRFDVKTLAVGPDGGGPSDAVQGVSGAAAPGGRNFRLRMTVLTLAALNPEDQTRARAAIVAGAGLDESGGDSLAFEVGPIVMPLPAAAMIPDTLPAAAAPARSPDAAGPAAPAGVVGWWVAAMAILAAIWLAAAMLYRRGALLSPVDRDLFVERVRAQLGREGGDDQ